MTVVIVVVLILVVGGVVAAMVLSLTAPPPIDGPGSPPHVTFAPPNQVAPGTFTVTIAGVSAMVPFPLFQVTVLNGTSIAIAATDLDQVESSGATGSGLSLTLTDLGGSGAGRLNGGDFFRLSGLSGTASYELRLLWKQSGEIVQLITI